MAIFGIGAGKMELSLNGTNYRAGDTITGNARLTINDPIKAHGVLVSFWGERKVRSYKFSSGRGRPAETTEILFKVEKKVDDERQYQKTVQPVSYDFSLQIPENALQKVELGDGIIGKVVGALQQMSQGSIRFYVQAKLDIPMGFDVSKKIEVFVTPKSTMPQSIQ